MKLLGEDNAEGARKIYILLLPLFAESGGGDFELERIWYGIPFHYEGT